MDAALADLLSTTSGTTDSWGVSGSSLDAPRLKVGAVSMLLNDVRGLKHSNKALNRGIRGSGDELAWVGIGPGTGVGVERWETGDATTGDVD